uniref:Uncharacterized protein n=1 Tax=Ditylenchus dipsaci TaxID=166011 RepID=A0A915DA96_9BILA
MWQNIKDSTERGRMKSNSQEQIKSVEAVRRSQMSESWPDERNKNVSDVKCFHSGEHNKIECGLNSSPPSSPNHPSNMSPQTMQKQQKKRQMPYKCRLRTVKK